MSYPSGPIEVFTDEDTTPTSAQGGYAGGESTAAAVRMTLDQSSKALGTVDNLAVTASTLDYGQEATATISGSSPWKTIHVGIPKGMSQDVGQQLVTDAQTAADQSTASAADAAQAVTLAQQAQAAAYNVPDVAMRDIVNNPATETRSALEENFAPSVDATAPEASVPAKVDEAADHYTPTEVRARAAPEYFLGDRRWDDGNYSSAAIEAILADAVKGEGMMAAVIKPGGDTSRPIVLDRTLNVNRAALTFRGFGIGSPSDYSAIYGSRGGTNVRWAGPSGVPMLRITDCRHLVIEDMHFQGNTASPPSAAINLHNPGGSSNNANISISRVLTGYLPWLPTGGYEMDYGVLIDGANLNNDQFYFHDCVFSQATLAQVKIANQQSIWGSFVNCSFLSASTRTAKGLQTDASVTLFNPQFNSCATDIDLPSGGARVTSIGHQSEHSARVANIAGNGSGLTIHGGTVGMNEYAHPDDGEQRLFNALSLGSNGFLTLNGVFFYSRPGATVRPKVRVRGSSSVTTVGELSITACSGLQPEDFDVRGGIGSIRKLRVFIQSGEVNVNTLLTGVTEEQLIVTAMT